MRFAKIWIGIVPAAVTVVILVEAIVMAQLTNKLDIDTVKTTIQVQQFKPHAVSQVTGDAIDKNQCGDYKNR